MTRPGPGPWFPSLRRAWRSIMEKRPDPFIQLLDMREAEMWRREQAARAARETRATGYVNDLLATQIQETGRGSTLGLTLADIVVTAEALGLRADELVLSGSQIIATPRRPANSQKAPSDA